MVKNTPANAGGARDGGLIPGLGRSPVEGNGNPLHCSCLGNPMNRGTGRLQSIGHKRVRYDVATQQESHS